MISSALNGLLKSAAGQTGSAAKSLHRSCTLPTHFEPLEVKPLPQFDCPQIYVVGLGPGHMDAMTIGTLRLLKGASRVLIRTAQHPTVSELANQGISYEALDELYEDADDFEAVYRSIAVRVIEEARRVFEADASAYLVYAVPGSPFIGERSVSLLRDIADKAGVKVVIVPAVSFLDSVYSSAGIDPFEGLQIVDALSIDAVPINVNVVLLVPQVYNRITASAVKTRLLQVYPDEHPAVLVTAAGTGHERVAHIKLYEIDRTDDLDHLTTLIVPPLKPRLDVCGYEKAAAAFSELVAVMAKLRGDNGCPWDREQTHESLKKYLLEETYEALDTIDRGDMDKLCEELGDVMLQTVFHAQIANEEGYFDASDVVSGIVEKLIRRHPHVFGTVQVDSAEAVLRNWEKIKAAERGEAERFSRVFDSVPVALPALMRAEIVQSKASKVGFDWQDFRPAFSKVEEEIAELKEALDSLNSATASNDRNRLVKEELGDLLFAIVNVARLLDIDPEDALKSTVSKFISRFKYIEEKAAAAGTAIYDMTLEDMDKLWEESKRVLHRDQNK